MSVKECDASSLSHEIRTFPATNIAARREVGIVLGGISRLFSSHRMEMIVGGLIAVEIKAVGKLLPVREAQLDTYFKLSGLHLGLLINFNVLLLRYGIKRRIWSH